MFYPATNGHGIEISAIYGDRVALLRNILQEMGFGQVYPLAASIRRLGCWAVGLLGCWAVHYPNKETTLFFRLSRFFLKLSKLFSTIRNKRRQSPALLAFRPGSSPTNICQSTLNYRKLPHKGRIEQSRRHHFLRIQHQARHFTQQHFKRQRRNR